MEGVTGFGLKLQKVRSHLVQQGQAIVALQEALVGESEHLRRLDQAQSIREMRSQVVRKIEALMHSESAASAASGTAALIGSGASFLLGAIAAAASGSREHPLVVGTRMANAVLENKEPYGSVLVAVGPRGVPDDVNVISVSQWARESGRSEAAVEAALKARGQLLMTPDAFNRLMDSLEHGVLGGNVVLPVSAKNLLPPPVVAQIALVARRAMVGLPARHVSDPSVSVEKQP
ncbi:MAG: hypothetical protein Q7T04_05060 [Dehalococcoidia bacterium]|nr:hypothetical protein [Dehalococcoidia bacterium]